MHSNPQQNLLQTVVSMSRKAPFSQLEKLITSINALFTEVVQFRVFLLWPGNKASILTLMKATKTNV